MTSGRSVGTNSARIEHLYNSWDIVAEKYDRKRCKCQMLLESTVGILIQANSTERRRERLHRHLQRETTEIMSYQRTTRSKKRELNVMQEIVDSGERILRNNLHKQFRLVLWFFAEVGLGAPCAGDHVGCFLAYHYCWRVSVS